MAVMSPCLIGEALGGATSSEMVENAGVRSPTFIWDPVYSCAHWLRPRNSPLPPAFGLIYEGAIGQPR
jgi:hypothetical protein